MTPWILAHQAPLSMEFPRQESWIELPFPSLGDFPVPRIEPTSPALQTILYHWATREAPITTPINRWETWDSNPEGRAGVRTQAAQPWDLCSQPLCLQRVLLCETSVGDRQQLTFFPVIIDWETSPPVSVHANSSSNMNNNFFHPCVHHLPP